MPELGRVMGPKIFPDVSETHQRFVERREVCALATTDASRARERPTRARAPRLTRGSAKNQRAPIHGARRYARLDPERSCDARGARASSSRCIACASRDLRGPASRHGVHGRVLGDRDSRPRASTGTRGGTHADDPERRASSPIPSPYARPFVSLCAPPRTFHALPLPSEPLPGAPSHPPSISFPPRADSSPRSQSHARARLRRPRGAPATHLPRPRPLRRAAPLGSPSGGRRHAPHGAARARRAPARVAPGFEPITPASPPRWFPNRQRERPRRRRRRRAHLPSGERVARRRRRRRGSARPTVRRRELRRRRTDVLRGPRGDGWHPPRRSTRRRGSGGRRIDTNRRRGRRTDATRERGVRRSRRRDRRARQSASPVRARDEIRPVGSLRRRGRPIDGSRRAIEPSNHRRRVGIGRARRRRRGRLRR